MTLRDDKQMKADRGYQSAIDLRKALDRGRVENIVSYIEDRDVLTIRIDRDDADRLIALIAQPGRES